MEEHLFSGQYRHSIDEKGRLTIPVYFRELLATDGAYVTRGFDHNLMVVPKHSFNIIRDRIVHMSWTDPIARSLRRLILGSAEPVEPDRVGRILVQQYLRQSVGLVDEAVVVGVGEYFELWSPDSWAEQEAKLLDDEANEHRYATLDLSI
jgi:MraZ protein